MVAYTMNFEQMKAGIKTGYIKKFPRHCDLKIQPLTVFRGLGYNKCTVGEEQSNFFISQKKKI